MFEDTSLWLILPLIVLVVGGCSCLVLSTCKSFVTNRILFAFSLMVFALVALELVLRLGAPFSLAFGHSFQFDDEATLFKLAITLVTMAILTYGKQTLEVFKTQMGEFYALVMFATAGMFLLVSAMNLLTIFLGIELMSLPLYALVAIYRQDKKATEAALKYFVMGALSSGLLLYGFSLLYGATGHFSLVEIHQYLALPNHITLMTGLASVFVVAGLAFKLGVAPFHMWVPDVYEAAPTPVACTIATTPKIAMTAMLLHMFPQALSQLSAHWTMMFTAMALLSVIFGNIIALIQTNYKRMIAYSSVSHMGVLVLGLINNNHIGAQAMIFYIITYALTTTVALGGCMILKNNFNESCLIDDFKGLNKAYPMLAFWLMLAMFSLAGVPPLVGFMAKFSILDALLKSNHTVWAILVVLSSVIGAFYYIRVIKAMYFEQPEQEGTLLLAAGKSVRCCFAANGVLLFILGVVPGVLYSYILKVL